MGRDASGALLPHGRGDFNPLSPHGERLLDTMARVMEVYFNPLSPHGERPRAKTARNGSPSFQSTLPAWGETLLCQPWPAQASDFNPLSPHGERHPLFLVYWIQLFRFQSTLPAWGETEGRPPAGNGSNDFNPLSPHGERRQPAQWCGQRWHFNPLSPHGERRGQNVEFQTTKSFQSTLPAWGETSCISGRAVL